MRRRALSLLIVVVWVLLWDGFTVGQLLAGIAVAVVLLALLRPPDSNRQVRVPFRPLAVARLARWFVYQVVISNAQVARAALRPGRHVRPGVVRVPLRTRSPQLAALIANLAALSPGMQPIGSTDDPPSIDVHVLILESDDQARAVVRRLEDLVVAAFGTDDERFAP